MLTVARNFVLFLCITNTFSLYPQDLATSLTNLTTALTQLEQTLQPTQTPPPQPEPTLQQQLAAFWAQLTPEQQQLLQRDPAQLAQLLAGQSPAGPGAPPPPPAPKGKIPPPPPPFKPTAKAAPLKTALFSPEEKAKIENDYKVELTQAQASMNDEQKKNYLLAKIKTLNQTKNTLQDNLGKLSGEEKTETQKNIERTKVQLEILQQFVKPFEKEIKKEAEGKEQLAKELAEAMKKRRERTKPEEE